MPFATETELTPTVKIRVQYYALLRELMARDVEDVDVPCTLTVSGLLEFLRARHLVLREDRRAGAVLDSCACAINMIYVDDDEDGKRTFREGDEVALIPPVSGG
ncbi:hypothetical protein PYCC9005_005722 [Savitreella phatthalungensis]